MKAPRYCIGIDLGTSNCALAYVDTIERNPPGKVLLIDQLVSPTALEARTILPSFCYLPPEGEQIAACPFQDPTELAVPAPVVGAYALEQTGMIPDRVITSAKSWLTHRGVDRLAPLLPWSSELVPDRGKLSPVAVSALYLRHIKDFWNSSLGKFLAEYRFENQDVTITVPASFSEDALELTLEAARLAGYPETVRLLEEPQAALYAYLENPELRSKFGALCSDRGRLRLLVCDVGGGTSDFSLFEIQPGDTEPKIQRVAVSDHILLGGDNIDLAIAHSASQAGEQQLTAKQWQFLVHRCRVLKEQIFDRAQGGEIPEELHRISIPGMGSNLFAGSLTVELSSVRIQEIAVEGFFPAVSGASAALDIRAGIQEWGLPFAKDPAVTRHLHAFLENQSVDAVLFNGGTLRPGKLRERLLAEIARWQDGRPALELPSSDLMLAVARGAARYGYALRGKSGLITSDYARSLYLQVESEGVGSTGLVCVVPHGFHVNQRAKLEGLEFELVLGQPVRFQIYSSRTRDHDALGEVVELSDGFEALPPLQTVLEVPPELKAAKQRTARVNLEAYLDEVGLLRLSCVGAEGDQQAAQRWSLSFGLRPAAADAQEALRTEIPEEKFRAGENLFNLYYGKGAAPDRSPKYMMRELETLMGRTREEWDLATLRGLWPALHPGISRRGRSVAHESSWLYAAGYLLRPGYGTELDKPYVSQLWRAFELGLSFPKENQVLMQWYIMWRRVAGGLSEVQQETIFQKYINPARSQSDTPELLRMLGSLERVSHASKAALAKTLIGRISGRRKTGMAPLIWVLGRLGSRVPLYGSAHQVVKPSEIAEWFAELGQLDWREGELSHLCAAFAQICRRTGDRMRDVPDELRKKVVFKMQHSGATASHLAMLQELIEVSHEDSVRLFGEELPAGLRLVSP